MGLFSKISKLGKQVATQPSDQNRDIAQQIDSQAMWSQFDKQLQSEQSEELANNFPEDNGSASVVFEVSLENDSADNDEKWTGVKRPREEYEAIATGEIEKRIFDYGNGFGDSETKERTNITVAEPCGFDFSDVIVNSSDWIDFETGEAEARNSCITPNGSNCCKIANDWIGLVPFLRTIPSYIPEFSSNAVQWYLDRLYTIMWDESNLQSAEEHFDFSCYANIVIEPLTQTGKIKRFPLRACVDVAHLAHQSINLESYYLKDGTIGKGTITHADGSNLFILDFTFDAKQKSYYVKKARLNEGFKVDGFVTLYPH